MIPDGRAVIIGMNNEDGGEALALHPATRAGARLLKFSGMTRDEMIAGFQRVNLLYAQSWVMTEARRAADRLMEHLGGRTCVVLGRDAWRALGLPHQARFWERHTHRFVAGFPPAETEACFYSIPHPSGLNHYYNRRDNQKKAAEVLYDALRRSKEKSVVSHA